MAGQLFGPQKESKLKDVETMAKATMSVVRGKIEQKDVMKIEILPHQTEEGILSSKPIYAIGSLHWGAYRDALSRRDKYWYFGSLRDYATFLFNAFDSKLTWNCSSKLLYTDPCPGCSNCYQKRWNSNGENRRRWWSMFIPRFKPAATQQNEPDLSKNKNDLCQVQTELNVNPSEIIIENNTTRSMDEKPKLTIKLGPSELDSFDFISNSWTRVRHPVEQSNFVETIDARTIDLIPENVASEENEIFYSIDNESFEVKPIRISVVPRAIQLYTM